jgi:hypothetical protein
MTETILKFINSEDMMSEMAVNAYNTWKTNYSFEVFSERLNNIIMNSLNKKVV